MGGYDGVSIEGFVHFSVASRDDDVEVFFRLALVLSGELSNFIK